MKKKFVLLMELFDMTTFTKEGFCIPFQMQESYNYTSEIVIMSPLKKDVLDFENKYRGVKIVSLEKHYFYKWFSPKLRMYLYMIFNARRIDYFMRIHITTISVMLINLYKILNPHGIAYLKMDTEPDNAYNILYYYVKIANPIKRLIKKNVFRFFINCVDFVSVETKKCYEIMAQGYDGLFFKKLVLLPNGIDQYAAYKAVPVLREYQEKENVFLTVGRIGTKQKNNEFFLQSIAKVKNLNDWKFIFIGPIEESFKKWIQNYFDNYPFLKKSILFLGPIYDQETLYKYFDQSKVFVLSSSHESSGIVLYEAAWFKNFILSTPVGAAPDIITDSNGVLVDINDENALTDIISKIISGKYDKVLENLHFQDNIIYGYRLDQIIL